MTTAWGQHKTMRLIELSSRPFSKLKAQNPPNPFHHKPICRTVECSCSHSPEIPHHTMSHTAHTSPGDALRLLAELAAERSNELNQYDGDPADIDNDDGTDSDCPILDSFVADGGEIAVLQITNFTLAEHRGLYDHLSPFLVQNYNVGRGKRSKYNAKDVLFM